MDAFYMHHHVAFSPYDEGGALNIDGACKKALIISLRLRVMT